MRVPSALLMAASVTALLTTAAPSSAAIARACGPGYTGVIVYDATGDLVTACVRTSDVTAYVDGATAYVGEVRYWAENARPRCYSYPDGSIACEKPRPLPLPFD